MRVKICKSGLCGYSAKNGWGFEVVKYRIYLDDLIEDIRETYGTNCKIAYSKQVQGELNKARAKMYEDLNKKCEENSKDIADLGNRFYFKALDGIGDTNLMRAKVENLEKEIEKLKKAIKTTKVKKK